MPVTIDGANGVSKVAPGGVNQEAIADGVVGKGPMFAAYQSTLQTTPSGGGVWTVQLQGEEYASNGMFNPTGATVNGVPAYAFKPNVAGWYALSGTIAWSPNGTGARMCGITKNGGEVKRGSSTAAAASDYGTAVVSALVYLNGTTDYVNFTGYQSSGGNLNTVAGAYLVYFCGHLVRAA